jgi:hypothetical protein
MQATGDLKGKVEAATREPTFVQKFTPQKVGIYLRMCIPNSVITQTWSCPIGNQYSLRLQHHCQEISLPKATREGFH